MSRDGLPKNANQSRQTTASTPTPLTTANVAAHTAIASTIPPETHRIQRWLAYTGDRQSQTRQANDWDRLVKEDELAAAIERATQHGNKDGEK